MKTKSKKNKVKYKKYHIKQQKKKNVDYIKI